MTKENKKIEKGSQEYKEAVEQQFQDVCVIMNLKVPKDYIPNHSNISSWIQEAFDNRCSDCSERQREAEWGEDRPDGHIYNDFVIANMNNKEEIDKIVKSFEDDKSWIGETDFTIINVTHKDAIEKYLEKLFDLIDTSKYKKITIKLEEFAALTGFNMQNLYDHDPSKQMRYFVYLEIKYVLFHAGIICECVEDYLPIICLCRKTERDIFPRIYVGGDGVYDESIIFVEK